MENSYSRQREDQNLRKAMAIELAKAYCAKLGYNPEKVNSQRYCELPGCVLFAQPSGIKPDGLKNDIATQPLPTLILKTVNGALAFETTEHTKKYLS